MRAPSLVGQKFGRLLVIEECVKNRRTRLICLCDCGKTHEVARYDAIRTDGKQARSCGCYQKDAASKANTTHGKSSGYKKRRGRTYNSWAAMKQRCQYSNHKQYKDYGGRGVVVCERWQSFELFLEDMGECPPGHSIDRIDNNGNYEPVNCRWATAREQKINSSTTRFITLSGERMSLTDWCLRLNMPRSAVSTRINRLGWSPEKALTTPIKQVHKSAPPQN